MKELVAKINELYAAFAADAEAQVAKGGRCSRTQGFSGNREGSQGVQKGICRGR